MTDLPPAAFHPAPLRQDGAELLLSCRIADPVDGLCRILMLLARCGIAVRGLAVAEAAEGGWRAEIGLRGSLPFALEHLHDRLRSMPGTLAAGPEDGGGYAPRSGSRSSLQPAMRQEPSCNCRMV